MFYISRTSLLSPHFANKNQDQPTYYHFHLHIVSISLEPNATQAVGKAFSLPNLISQLETMAGDPEVGMANVDITYTLGENHDLWTAVFLPLKKGTTG